MKHIIQFISFHFLNVQMSAFCKQGGNDVLYLFVLSQRLFVWEHVDDVFRVFGPRWFEFRLLSAA